MSRIRVTGGEWRSRLINVADVTGLRPTPDRVRETLFNWLGQDLHGRRCVDLFAGSGILGIEAASRGAEEVVLIEKDRQAFAQLQRNVAAFDAARLRLVRSDALEFLAACGGGRAKGKDGYDLLLLDPPYRQGWLDKVAPLLVRALKPDALIYAEAEYRLDALGEWRTIKQGTAGQVFYHLLERT